MKRPTIDVRPLTAALTGLVMALIATGCLRSGTPPLVSDADATAGYSDGQDTNIRERREGLLERWSNPIAKVIITRNDIAQFRDRRASDILRRLPGVFVEPPVGGRGRSARLRGIGAQYTQILVNGERISGGSERRHFELDRIPAEMIEQIELIKNPSAEYGSDAVAGIVNIILRQAPDPRRHTLLDELRGGRQTHTTEP